MTGDQFFQLLLTLLPSIVVFLTAYYLLRQLLGSRNNTQNNQIMADAKRDDRKQTLPLRLQAYERLTLFLERIAPGTLVFRVHKNNMTARMLHAELLATVREEFERRLLAYQPLYVLRPRDTFLDLFTYCCKAKVANAQPDLERLGRTR